MSPFYPLKTIRNVGPRQIGETSFLLHQLQQKGQSVPDSWIISAEEFARSRQQLIAREPIFADWPQILWHTPKATGYPVQQLAHRLQRPLSNLSLALPWTDLLSQFDCSTVRLVPSLWFGQNSPVIPFVQMLDTPLCWAEPEHLEAAVKRVWMSILNAKSLAFWSKWTSVTGHYPTHVEVAVIVQKMERATLSGTMARQSDEVVIEAVCGLPEARSECCPDIYRSSFTASPEFDWQADWQVGYQERRYEPRDGQFPGHVYEECWVLEAQAQTALETLDNTAKYCLGMLAIQLRDWFDRSLRVEWYFSQQTQTLQLWRANDWPMPVLLSGHHERQLTSGHTASRGEAYGIALVLEPDTPLPATAHQHIVVASEVAPEWLPLLKTASGIVSERGGLTSHAAVLARELGLPAIVGVADVTRRFSTGDKLHLDGDRGLVEFVTTLPKIPTPSVPLPNLSWESHHTEIWLNLSQPDMAANAATLPVTGVGLLRSEWLMMSVLERRHPYHWIDMNQQETLKNRLLSQLRPILRAFFPRPVKYRTLDIRSNEFAQLLGAPSVEANPMLGIRGAFSYRHYVAFFQLELELLKCLQNEGYENLQVILPFVRTVEEFVDCRDLIQEIGLHRSSDFRVWIMAEVPSVLFLLPQYVIAGVQGISIGTHDLTQLLLGIDRDQPLFSDYFDTIHPAIAAAIAQLIQQTHTLGIPCQLCGASPLSHPAFIEATVRQGITGISVDIAAVEAAAQLIQQAESSS